MTSLSVSPNPLVQGQTATLSGNPGDTIDLDWDPPSTPTSVTLGPDGKARLPVPRKATSLIATAPNGDTLAVTAGP